MGGAGNCCLSALQIRYTFMFACTISHACNFPNPLIMLIALTLFLKPFASFAPASESSAAFTMVLVSRARKRKGHGERKKMKYCCKQYNFSTWTDAARFILADTTGPSTMFSPCCGLETAMQAWRALSPPGTGYKFGVPFTHSWDTDKTLGPQILHAHGGNGFAMVGPASGDFTRERLASLPSVEFICSGPPCPPFSRSGVSGSWGDQRAEAFMQVLLLIKDQILRASSRLAAFVIENVAGMQDKRAGMDQSPLEEVLDWLAKELAPAANRWTCWTWQVEANRLGLPQRRQRTFICGRNSEAFHRDYPHIEPRHINIPRIYLTQLLDASAPPQHDLLTDIMRSSLATYITNVEKELICGEYRDVVAVFDLSRAAGKKRPMQSRSDGQCMCLTAHNAYLWLQGFGEVAKYERFISGAERAKLQGMDVEVSGRVKSTQSCQVRVFGNAMAVPMIGVVMACLWSEHKPRTIE